METDKSGPKKKIGLLGGTLDPIHYGHLRAAEEVYEILGLDEVWFVPAYQPPHKLTRHLTPFKQRFEMVKLAIRGSNHFKVKDFEARRKGVSYSVDLLRQIKALYGRQCLFYFILGTDAAIDIESWKEWQSLPSLATLVIVQRPPVSIKEVKTRFSEIFPDIPIGQRTDVGEEQPAIIMLETTALDISSTNIRALAGRNRSIRFLLPEDVRSYIMKNKLYMKDYTDKICRPDNGQPVEGIDAARCIYDQILNNKGEQIVVLDMRSISPVADFFIIAQGRSTRHVQGMASRMKRELSRQKIKCHSIEGEEEGKWVLMDFDDVVVHLFYEPVRIFYDLEGLWNEAPRLVMTVDGLKPEEKDE